MLCALAGRALEGAGPLNPLGAFGVTWAGVATAVDKAGNIYVAGGTTSSSVPTTAGAFQRSAEPTQFGTETLPGPPPFGGPRPVYCRHAFVAKLDPAGTQIIYATYLAGTGDDFARAIALDGAGNAYVVGSTGSTDFPVTTGAVQTSPGSGFITKLSPDGSRVVFSTFMTGGYGSAVAVDSSGNVFVAGDANGATFQTTPGAFQSGRFLGNDDVFVLKLNASGTALVYSTLLGGTLQDTATALAVDDAGDAYVAGYTGSQSCGSLSLQVSIRSARRHRAVGSPCAS